MVKGGIAWKERSVREKRCGWKVVRDGGEKRSCGFVVDVWRDAAERSCELGDGGRLGEIWVYDWCTE